MLNYTISMLSNVYEKTSSLLNSTCLIPNQTAVGLICPSNDPAEIALDEEKCTINYPSTADIIRCMEECYNCCFNATQAFYYSCDQPLVSDDDSQTNVLGWGLLSVGVTAMFVSLKFFYNTQQAQVVTNKNKLGYGISALTSASLLTAGASLFGSSVAIPTGLASFGLFSLVGVGIARQSRIPVVDANVNLLNPNPNNVDP